jgi:hypothetical protein
MAGDDSSMIIVVVMMVCFCSVILAGGFGYTCTGGSFDLDDFDMDKCLGKTTTTTTTGGGGNTDPGNNPPADEYAECEGQFYNEATTTCFGDQTAGIRWEWLDDDTARTCRGHTAKYGIMISSSYNNHVTKYRFPDVIGNMANSFSFNGGPPEFLTGNNIKFYITPLDAFDKKVATTAEYTLDNMNSAEKCTAHGTPVPWSQAQLVSTGTENAPDTQPCEGNVYLPVSECLRSGLVLNDENDPNRCGAGYQTVELDTNHPSYIAAKDGGSCEFSKAVPCSFPCAPSLPVVEKTQAMCDQEAYTYNNWRNSMGCVKDNFPHSSPPTDQSAYTRITGDCYPDGSADGVQATLAMEVSDDKLSCIPTYRWSACGFSVCPENCIGHWSEAWGPWDPPNLGQACDSEQVRYKTATYVIDHQKVGDGAACERGHGDTKIVDEDWNTRDCYD